MKQKNKVQMKDRNIFLKKRKLTKSTSNYKGHNQNIPKLKDI